MRSRRTSEAALRYAELGYPVFPCAPGGKVAAHPARVPGRHDRRRADRGVVDEAPGREHRHARRRASSSSTWTARTTPGPAIRRRRRTSRAARCRSPRAAAGTTSSGSRPARPGGTRRARSRRRSTPAPTAATSSCRPRSWTGSRTAGPRRSNWTSRRTSCPSRPSWLAALLDGAATCSRGRVRRRGDGQVAPTGAHRAPQGADPRRRMATRSQPASGTPPWRAWREPCAGWG